jgi:hypothetical protein
MIVLTFWCIFNIVTEIEVLCFYCFWLTHDDAFLYRWLKFKYYEIITLNLAMFISLWVCRYHAIYKKEMWKCSM